MPRIISLAHDPGIAAIHKRSLSAFGDDVRVFEALADLIQEMARNPEPPRAFFCHHSHITAVAYAVTCGDPLAVLARVPTILVAEATPIAFPDIKKKMNVIHVARPSEVQDAEGFAHFMQALDRMKQANGNGIEASAFRAALKQVGTPMQSHEPSRWGRIGAWASKNFPFWPQPGA